MKAPHNGDSIEAVPDVTPRKSWRDESGWFDPQRDAEQHGVEQLRAADALILGRETYEGLAAFWPTQDGAYAELVNPIPKYVASRTTTEPLTWNSQLHGTDVADEAAALKASLPGNLISYGCGGTGEVPRAAGFG
jgi:dihydrofolate reductase